MWQELAKRQEGILTRAQAIETGLTRHQIEANIAGNRWQRAGRAVYATFTGPLPRIAQFWVAVLSAGPGAVLSHDSVAELYGLDEPTGRIHVTVPAHRHPTRIPGVVLHRSRRIAEIRHPARTLSQTRLEEAIVDLTQTALTADDAIAWLAKAVGARATTAERLVATLDKRTRLRRRAVLYAALTTVLAGCNSLLEVKYRQRVEKAHGLPTGERQVRREGGRRYDDVVYKKYGVRVELDGQVAHPDHQKFRDWHRDNAIVEAGDRPLRYGLGDVDEYPCDVAGQASRVLQRAGWTGPPHPCHYPNCALRRPDERRHA